MSRKRYVMPYKDKAKQRKAQNESAARKRIRNLAKGFCAYCNEPALFGYTRCAKHREIHNKWGRENAHIYVERRRDAGTCLNCGRPIMDESNYCLICNDKGTHSRRKLYGVN